MPHCPMKFRYVRGRLAETAPRILDIGCGNGSPTLTKRWFPGCRYAGADIQRYNQSDADVAAMDEFFSAWRGWIRLRCHSGVELRFRDSQSRCRTHAEPAPIVAELCGKLKPGGFFWIAFPSERSLRLPHSEDETLNFYDDPTHIYLPNVDEIAGILKANGVNVLDAGRSREGFWTSIADGVKLSKRVVRKGFTGRFSGRGLWYVLGFEDHVLGQRKVG